MWESCHIQRIRLIWPMTLTFGERQTSFILLLRKVILLRMFYFWEKSFFWEWHFILLLRKVILLRMTNVNYFTFEKSRSFEKSHMSFNSLIWGMTLTFTNPHSTKNSHIRFEEWQQSFCVAVCCSVLQCVAACCSVSYSIRGMTKVNHLTFDIWQQSSIRHFTKVMTLQCCSVMLQCHVAVSCCSVMLQCAM